MCMRHLQKCDPSYQKVQRLALNTMCYGPLTLNKLKEHVPGRIANFHINFTFEVYLIVSLLKLYNKCLQSELSYHTEVNTVTVNAFFFLNRSFQVFVRLFQNLSKNPIIKILVSFWAAALRWYQKLHFHFWTLKVPFDMTLKVPFDMTDHKLMIFSCCCCCSFFQYHIPVTHSTQIPDPRNNANHANPNTPICGVHVIPIWCVCDTHVMAMWCAHVIPINNDIFLFVFSVSHSSYTPHTDSRPRKQCEPHQPKYPYLKSDLALPFNPRPLQNVSEARDAYSGPNISNVDEEQDKLREFKQENRERVKDGKRVHFKFGNDDPNHVSEAMDVFTQNSMDDVLPAGKLNADDPHYPHFESR